MNKTILNIVLGMTAASALLSSCSTEEIDTYNGEASGIFIQEVRSFDIFYNPMTYRDSIEYSFSSYPEETKYLNARVVIRTIGFTTDYDRPYKVEVIPEETTGIEGVDFDLSENASVIKAGESTDNFYIKMLRTPKLRSERVKVAIRIVPNEHFSVPITELKNSASWNIDGNFLPTDRYKVIFSEKYTLPWPNDIYWPDYFGSYSVTKLLFVNEVMGWTYTSWSDGTVAYGKLAFAADETRRQLQKKADEGNPVIDEDGSYMQLADSYKVNYNAYITDNE